MHATIMTVEPSDFCFRRRSLSLRLSVGMKTYWPDKSPYRDSNPRVKIGTISGLSSSAPPLPFAPQPTDWLCFVKNNQPIP